MLPHDFSPLPEVGEGLGVGSEPLFLKWQSFHQTTREIKRGDVLSPRILYVVR